MTRITRRQAAQAFNLSAPLDMALKDVPEKRKPDPNALKEWRIQAAAIKALRARMAVDKNLWYEINLIEGVRTPARAAMMKMMGGQQGPNDLTLYRRVQNPLTAMARRAGLTAETNGYSLHVHRIEFKLPGRNLTPAQEAWFAFHRSCGVPCSRVDNLQEFLRILDGF